MDPERFFKYPQLATHKQYEALRAFYVEKVPGTEVARRYGYTYAAFNSLRQRFKADGVNFFATPTPGPKGPRIPVEMREKVIECRKKGLSVGEIFEVCNSLCASLGTSTIDRILAQEGFPKLARRTQLKIGLTKDHTIVPEAARVLSNDELSGWDCESTVGGVFLFAPLIEHYQLPTIIEKLKLPETQRIGATNYLLSMLALKLVGKERLSQISDFNFDQGLGLFAGLNVLPKCTAISTYSYRFAQKQVRMLMEQFVSRQNCIRTYGSDTINLDFHTVQHYGEESELENHWAGARGKSVKGVLTLFAQDGDSRCQLYVDSDLKRSESNDAILEFVTFWKKVRGTIKQTLVFDSRFTSYENLAELNKNNIRFITLRRRGKNLIDEMRNIAPEQWQRLRLDVPRRKYNNPAVYDSVISLRDYDDKIRQIVMKDNGHESPAFFITNDFKASPKDIILKYSKRWNIENVIEEAIAFFNINALSSPILIKVHLDLLLTMIADTLYYHLAQKLRCFEACDAQKIFRHFVDMPARIQVDDKQIHVRYPLRAHSPVLRSAGLDKYTQPLSWLGNRTIKYYWG